MSLLRDELFELLKKMSEENVAVVLKFAKKIKEVDHIEYDQEELSPTEIEMIHASEKDYNKGDYFCWRDVKRSEVCGNVFQDGN